jgi:catechol 2,3-dioxygenase-like lactoylglutathione lyase family enzyme
LLGGPSRTARFAESVTTRGARWFNGEVLHHVSLEVDPEDAGRFAELLAAIGFDAIESPDPLGDGVRWFDGGGTQVHLILTPAASAPVLGHAAFVAADFDATLGSLRELGFEVDEARELWGERRAFVLAPGGHRIELMAAPPR